MLLSLIDLLLSENRDHFCMHPLLKTEPLAKNEGLYALIAIVLASMTLFFKPVVDLISFVAPWFVFMTVLFFLILLMVMAFGVSGKDITEIVKSDKLVTWTIITFAIAILLFGLSQVFGPYLAGDNQSDNAFNQTVRDIVFHPKMLGVIFTLLLATFAVKLISSK